MKTKPITPYARLKTAFREYVSKVEYPEKKLMWRYTKEGLSSNWKLDDLAQRVAAAEQLGYDVILQADEQGLRVMYRKKIPAAPWEVR